jgi:hypothetical protein
LPKLETADHEAKGRATRLAAVDRVMAINFRAVATSSGRVAKGPAEFALQRKFNLKRRRRLGWPIIAIKPCWLGQRQEVSIPNDVGA